MKNAIRTLTTTILVTAIAITGISVDTTTVTAATIQGGEFQNNGLITLKPGDEVKLTVTDTAGEFKYSETKGNDDVVSLYRWYSSDTSVFKVETDFYDETLDWTECVMIIGAGPGTATVTGKAKGPHPDITMTVTVKLPKATAKQKKCKHKYKVTKKATCERAGIKTCKKCKFQKTIKELGHNFVEKKEMVTKYEYRTEDYYCHGKGMTCDWHITLKFDCKTGNIIGDENYPSRDEFFDALDDHIISTGCNGTWGNSGWSTYYNPYEEEEPVNVCTRCGYKRYKNANYNKD